MEQRFEKLYNIEPVGNPELIEGIARKFINATDDFHSASEQAREQLVGIVTSVLYDAQAKAQDSKSVCVSTIGVTYNNMRGTIVALGERVKPEAEPALRAVWLRDNAQE